MSPSSQGALKSPHTLGESLAVHKAQAALSLFSEHDSCIEVQLGRTRIHCEVWPLQTRIIVLRGHCCTAFLFFRDEELAQTLLTWLFSEEPLPISGKIRAAPSGMEDGALTLTRNPSIQALPRSTSTVSEAALCAASPPQVHGLEREKRDID